jgi:hypothetical protein
MASAAKWRHHQQQLKAYQRYGGGIGVMAA